MTNSKALVEVRSSPPTHWVGDGFPVSSVFSPRAVGDRISPFVLMDYAGPARFEPSDTPRGVDSHPHRGFETVTVVYKGELQHRDTAGNHGGIGPGDVQWMTAASGVLHEEKHSAAFTRDGGELEMAQLWVNLPARHKMDPPRYQELGARRIPQVDLPNGAGVVRVIAGEFMKTPGAAKTFTPVILWDVRLRGGADVALPIPDGFNAAVYVRRGEIRVGQNETATGGQLAIFSPQDAEVRVRASTDAEILVLGGQPIDEPVVAYGPFVMNSQAEIEQAIADVRAGRFGEL